MILLLLAFLSCLQFSSASMECLVDRKQCSTESRLLTTKLGVATMEECSQLCQDNQDCKAFTHFGSKNPFLSEACLLFYSCEQRVECEDCVTGSKQEECTCSIGYEGFKNADNVENLLDKILDELECKKRCKLSRNCKAYTYYNGDDIANPHTCVLLTRTEFIGGSWPCKHCSTGPSHCDAGLPCKVKTFNTTFPVFAAVEGSEVIGFHTGEKDCFVDLNAVLIGKGGDGTYHSSYGFGRGGGSGYFKAGTLKMTARDKTINIKSGYYNTSITIGGQVVLEVQNGKDDVGYGGGDGYSGGGGIDAKGGSAGGNGSDGSKPGRRHGKGGKGSGEDVTQIKMKSFEFTPGEGGDGLFGGGGGGVLVNGAGPERSAYVSEYDGQGCGGGGGEGDGLPGCVLLEFS